MAGPAGLFLPRSSQKAFRKKTAERLSMMRISNRPSTVVMVPLRMIHAIPASGITPSTMEIKSITATKSPPYEMWSVANVSFAISKKSRALPILAAKVLRAFRRPSEG